MGRNTVINALHAALAAVCPIDGVAIVNPDDKTTWRIDFSASATPAQQQAAQSALAAFVPPNAPTVTSLTFRQLYTRAERVAITTAGFTDAEVRVFMDDASAAGTIDLSSREAQQGIAYLVANNLITQDRANQVLSGAAPPSA